jgi:arylsulfatase A-like enzyme
MVRESLLGSVSRRWSGRFNEEGAKAPLKTIFISLDTVCANRLSSLGSKRVSTPNLDRIAAESALFTRAFASDIPTQPSHTAVFTGRCGASTGIVAHFHPPARLDDEFAWLPSVFQEHGCRTGAVDHLFSMKEWFIRGYEDYMVPPGRSRSPASVINGLGFPWLAEHHQRDFFLFLHYWDAHIPYVPPEPYRSEYTAHLAGVVDPHVIDKIKDRPSYALFKRNLYDHLDEIPSLEFIEALHYAEVAYLDAEIGRLVDHLDGLGVLDDTAIVIFGDHGEVMTEHDAWFDHAGLYDSVVHVPLMIRAPGRVTPTRVDSLVSLTDVMPTVLELYGLADIPGVERLDGRSLFPVINGEVTEHRDAVYLSECTWQAKRGVRTADWKYIRCWDPGIYPRDEIELYDLTRDPDEQHNVASERPEIAAEMELRLEEFLDEKFRERPDPMPEVVDHGLPAVRRLTGVMAEDAELERQALMELADVEGHRDGTHVGNSHRVVDLRDSADSARATA